MRTTMNPILAIGVALGLPALAVAQQDDAHERFEEAGFEAVTLAREVQIARVQGEDGETYYFIGGMGMAAALTGAAPGTVESMTDATSGTAAATTEATVTAGGTTAGATPAATPGATGTAEAGATEASSGAAGQGLEEQLQATGIENYEIVGDATVGQLHTGGQTLYVIHGVHEGI